MVDNEYSTNIYKSLKISIGAVMKSSDMLKFIPDHLKTKTMCKHAVKKLPFVIRYVPDQYKTQQMRSKAVLEIGLSLTATKIKKRVIKLLTNTPIH